jgi:multiple sugar transport system permease protein
VINLELNTIELKASTSGSKKRLLLPYLLIAPIGLWIILTIILPLTDVIKESFLNTDFIGTKGKFIGFGNYQEVLLSVEYWKAWSKSIIWLFGNGILQTVLGFVIALLLNKARSKIAEAARTWMIISWVIPTIVVAIFWQWIFNGSYGILNHLLINFGLVDKPLNLLGNASLSLFTIIFINSWHWFPFMAVIILAGLATIPEELYESSAVDGANKWQQFWTITMPSLNSVTFVLGLVGTLWSFNIFDIIWILTQGGPVDTTTTIPVLIYQKAFGSFQLSKASAISVITAILLMLFVFLFVKYLSPDKQAERNN